jgi:hypothetical protein
MIHITVPLTTHARGLKPFIKNIIYGDIENIKRNQFNAMLTKKFKDSDAIFDLAKIESTRPDGSRSAFQYKGETYYSLYNRYTEDGGHLNEIASRIAAKELLLILAKVAAAPS